MQEQDNLEMKKGQGTKTKYQPNRPGIFNNTKKARGYALYIWNFDYLTPYQESKIQHHIYL